MVSVSHMQVELLITALSSIISTNGQGASMKEMTTSFQDIQTKVDLKFRGLDLLLLVLLNQLSFSVLIVTLLGFWGVLSFYTSLIVLNVWKNTSNVSFSLSFFFAFVSAKDIGGGFFRLLKALVSDWISNAMIVNRLWENSCLF